MNGNFSIELCSKMPKNLAQICYHSSSGKRPKRLSCYGNNDFVNTSNLTQEIDTPLSPSINYFNLFSWRDNLNCCPPLFLAPMEHLADSEFRIAISASIGGFDEACTEFIRVNDKVDWPDKVVRGLSKRYNSTELGEFPLGVQVMGSNPEMLGNMAQHLSKFRGAPRVDLNCGCPANKVTGNGAGSSLLKNPESVYRVVSAMVEGSLSPVSVKMRSGFNDSGLLKENLMAAQEAGASFVTLHPRTKVQSYNGNADWNLIGFAKDILSIPVVGNGDVTTVEKAFALVRETGCDGIMIGRGAVSDPFIFHKIKAAYRKVEYEPNQEVQQLIWFLNLLFPDSSSLDVEIETLKGKSRRLKQLSRYLFQKNKLLQGKLKEVLVTPDKEHIKLKQLVISNLKIYWSCEDKRSFQ